MAEAGIIKPSSSPWASSIVLVSKRDGSYRYYIDYRKVNDLTHKHSYPLPRIDSTLEALSRAAWFSTLDLKSGYWQAEMEEKDKEKTAFTSGSGLWQFRVMPMGLCNAAATFERLMEQVFVGMSWQKALVYLDDIIVYEKRFEDELRHLYEVSTRLSEANLKLSPKKCQLFQRSAEFLGHTVSGMASLAKTARSQPFVTGQPRKVRLRFNASWAYACTIACSFITSAK